MRAVGGVRNLKGLYGHQTGKLTTFEAQVRLMSLIWKHLDRLAIQNPKYLGQTPLRKWNYQTRKMSKYAGTQRGRKGLSGKEGLHGDLIQVWAPQENTEYPLRNSRYKRAVRH